ncbi:RNA polymerase sigma factor SigJ [Dactylosporangium aurantiacum]|uniref:RNA polymerase sigma factor SigJ n=1 Tax=Dactylosporangium aurantiacum TaxID=35754 RepID=A0A9Q9MH71_9ACTN|nr:RNA polymerase sigma factor SigJ [Dactylosporangium aurantiacum]MDG6108665.1 RNA polymerase sigma factor SigJ [Dactylosporangium aurantiacum]UWZ59123.1 RNA polymerase sigma factor SigJ [Dactylosporangium aurantiacum]
MDAGQRFEQHRRYLFAVAYRLLGSAADAEDAVQETLLRRYTSGADDLEHPRAWLTTVISRICLDMLGSARARRETYPGTWLPEPLAGYDDTDLGNEVALRESVRTAVLLVLETLSPAERVAFVLHDVFGMDFDRLADVVGRTPAACRQLASRARRRVRQEAPPRTPVTADEHRRVTAAFLKATADGDLTDLLALLDPRVVLRSDGGGEVLAARRPVHGPQQVLTLLSGLGRRYAGARARPVRLAGGPGYVLELGGTVLGVLAVDLAGGLITDLYLVVDPAKLRRLA